MGTVFEVFEADDSVKPSLVVFGGRLLLILNCLVPERDVQETWQLLQFNTPAVLPIQLFLRRDLIRRHQVVYVRNPLHIRRRMRIIRLTVKMMILTRNGQPSPTILDHVHFEIFEEVILLLNYGHLLLWQCLGLNIQKLSPLSPWL